MTVRIGMRAPDFTALSTKGPIVFSSLKGKWVVLFSYPADFTPVCTTEIVAFSERAEDFKKLEVQLLGLSSDTIYSHIAWLRELKEHFNTEASFPIIADTDRSISTEYNLIDEKSWGIVRGIFIIDPNQIVRWMMYSPPEIGRNVEEVLRTIKALQFNWDKKLSTPANWVPGDPGVLAAPTSLEDSYAREKDGAPRWYLKKSGY